jgi:hypothetical protein
VGNFDASERLVARLAPLLAGTDITPLKRVVWLVRMARHHALQGDSGKSAANFEQAQVLAQEEGLAFYQRILSMLQLYTGLSLDDVVGAARHASRLAELLEPGRRFDSVVYHLGHAWIGLQRADLGTALKHAESAANASAQTGLIGLTRLALILLAEVHTTRVLRMMRERAWKTCARWRAASLTILLWSIASCSPKRTLIVREVILRPRKKACARPSHKVPARAT